MKLSDLIIVMEGSIRNSEDLLTYLVRAKRSDYDSDSLRITDLTHRIEFKQILLELIRGVKEL